MAKSGPGKAYRKGLTFFQIADMFPDDAAAEAWFVERRWAEGPHCPHCGSLNIQTPIKHKSMTHRCRDCPKRVSSDTQFYEIRRHPDLRTVTQREAPSAVNAGRA